jgi:hypothetical protein
MIHLLKIIALIVAVTYSLRLVNAQSDLLVFCGLAIVGFCLYLFVQELVKIFYHLKSRI